MMMMMMMMMMMIMMMGKTNNKLEIFSYRLLDITKQKHTGIQKMLQYLRHFF